MCWLRQTSRQTSERRMLRHPPPTFASHRVTGHAVLQPFISTAPPSRLRCIRPKVLRPRQLRRDNSGTFRLLQGKRCIVWRRQMIHDSERQALAGLAALSR